MRGVNFLIYEGIKYIVFDEESESEVKNAKIQAPEGKKIRKNEIIIFRGLKKTGNSIISFFELGGL